MLAIVATFDSEMSSRDQRARQGIGSKFVWSIEILDISMVLSLSTKVADLR